MDLFRRDCSILFKTGVETFGLSHFYKMVLFLISTYLLFVYLYHIQQQLVRVLIYNIIRIVAKKLNYLKPAVFNVFMLKNKNV